MHDNMLLTIAIITSIIGLSMLSYEFLTLDEEKLMANNDNFQIMQGVVVKVTSKRDFTLIQMQRACNISIITFKQLNLSKGEYIRVLAKKNNQKNDQTINQLNQEWLAVKIVKS